MHDTQVAEAVKNLFNERDSMMQMNFKRIQMNCHYRPSLKQISRS